MKERFMGVTIYHNPRCSKSRQTLQLLRDHGVEPRIVEYLNEPPAAEQLDEILELLGFEPRQLLRTGESAYLEAGLDDMSLSREQIIRLMVKHPIVIERPVVVVDGKAAVGRPPENVLSILPQ